MPYEDVKTVQESEKVWERLLKKRIIGKGAKDELSKGLEPLLEYFCKNIHKQHKRLGGDFAVAWCSITRAQRDFCKRLLGPDLVFICLEMDKKILKERLNKRHPDEKDTAKVLFKVCKFSESASVDEDNVHAIAIDRQTSSEEVVEKVLAIANKYKSDQA